MNVLPNESVGTVCMVATSLESGQNGPRVPGVLCAGTHLNRALSFQIDDPNSTLEEVTDEAEAVRSVNKLGSNQALNADFLGSDYQTGQLYPFSLSSDPHTATFTLTNAAPMTPSFQERWYVNLNSLMERALTPQCGSGDDLYIITGAVPSDLKVKDRVSIPEFVWLAACCAVPAGGWAMGFVKHTGDREVIEDVMLRDLQRLLPFPLQLFQNNCGETDQDTEKMKKILEVVNQVQDEERRLDSDGGSGPSPASGAPGPPCHLPRHLGKGVAFWEDSWALSLPHSSSSAS